MNYPKELKYVKSHEWLKEEGDIVLIGISDFAQDALGDIVFVNLPEVDDELNIGEAFADVESVKAVSDIFSPVDGTVIEINEELMDNPALINETPYDAWIIKAGNVTAVEECMDAGEYEAFAAEAEE